MNTIFTIGIFLAFFLSFLLATKKQKNLSDKLLAIWLAVIGIHLSSYYIYTLDFWSKYPHLIGVTLPVPLLHGPLLFLYTLYSLRNDKHVREIDFLHFIPAALAWLYMSRFYFFYSAEEKIMVDTGVIDDFSIFATLAMIAFIVSGLIYPILAYCLVGKHQKLLNANYSYAEKLSLAWLKYCIWGLALIFLTVMFFTILQSAANIEFGFNVDFIYYTEIVLFVISIGYFGIQHQGLFSQTNSDSKIKIVPTKSQGGYQKSGLKPEIAKTVHQKLQHLMKTDKPFTNPKLTLSELAEQVDVSPNHLSQIINQYEQVNFHDFINKFRIEEFIQQATTNKEYSILAYALDAGFNSKSSFNNVFKKHKGIPPSKYIEHHV